MQFGKNVSDSWCFQDTAIENLFISEYMCEAPGDFVKVYLLAQMYASLDMDVEESLFASQLRLTKAKVAEAFDYWEQQGLIRREGSDKETLQLQSLRAQFCGGTACNKVQTSAGSTKPQEASDRFYISDENLAVLFTAVESILGRPLGGNEMPTINSWIEEYGATPEMIIYAYNYCYNTVGKEKVNYVGAVVKNWIELGLVTDEKIDDYIKNCDTRHAMIRRVFKELGLSRNPSEPEKKIFDRWIDDDGFTMDEILHACEKTIGANSPSIKYLDTILQKMHEAGKAGKKPLPQDHPVTAALVQKYYDYIREESKKKATKRREEVYSRLPAIKALDDEIREAMVNVIKNTSQSRLSEAAEFRQIRNRKIEERAALMEKAGFPADYTEDKYLCEKCKDTGLTEEGVKCSCYEQRAEEAKAWQISLQK